MVGWRNGARNSACRVRVTGNKDPHPSSPNALGEVARLRVGGGSKTAHLYTPSPPFPAKLILWRIRFALLCALCVCAQPPDGTALIFCSFTSDAASSSKRPRSACSDQRKSRQGRNCQESPSLTLWAALRPCGRGIWGGDIHRQQAPQRRLELDE